MRLEKNTIEEDKMKEYNITVNFQDGTIDSDFMELVENDYNSTTLKFKFDTDERVVLKMLYPDETVAYVNDIVNNEFTFGPGLLSQDGQYKMELTAYDGSGRLTNYATMDFYVRPELVSTDEIVEPDDRVPILDNLINEVENIDIDAAKEDGIATITITKKDGTTETVEIEDGAQGERGPAGPAGETGSTGPAGRDGVDGADGVSPTATVTKSGNIATITITDKNGTTTTTVSDGVNGTNGTNGTNGRDGVIQYTAGENITISENNVISATGGDLSNYYTKSEIDAYNIAGLHFSVYALGSNRTTHAYQIATNGSSGLSAGGDTDTWKEIYNDVLKHWKNGYNFIYVSTIGVGENNFAETMWIELTSINQTNITVYVRKLTERGKYTHTLTRDANNVVTNVSTSWDNNSGTYQIINSWNQQNITAKKIFTVLPESSVAPTTNDQMVNKKYVDDAISSAITDALGGSY